jgi:hypothetical protein
MKNSGVNPNLYSNYNFHDHLWTQQVTQRDELLELARRCVCIGGQYWMKIPNKNVWAVYRTVAEARKQAYNTWQNIYLKCGTQVTPQLIDTFFDGVELEQVLVGKKTIVQKNVVGSCPNLHGRIVIPYGPQFVEYDNRFYLNFTALNVVDGDDNFVNLGQSVLSLVYRALCNAPQLDPDAVVEADMLLEQVLTDTMTNLEFRFVMNWLAAIVQNPGINLQTNLWLIGQQQGIGKGTLMDVMKAIMGPELVGELNQDDIEGGWNDHLLGKCLVEVNEFDTKSNSKKGPKGWDQWIKRNTCEPTLNVRERLVGSYSVIHIGNFIFTTNDEAPLYLDKTDRRNMIVKTTDDPQWKAYASHVKRRLVQHNLKDLAKGFAWILEQVKVDMDLVSSAPMNQAKANVQAAQMDDAEGWVRDDIFVDRDVEMQAMALYGKFKEWFVKTNPSGKVPSSTSWGRQMGIMVSKGWVEKGKIPTGITYTVKSVFEDRTFDKVVVEGRFNAIVKDNKQTKDFDQTIERAGVDFDKITDIQKLRAALLEKDLKGDPRLD